MSGRENRLLRFAPITVGVAAASCWLFIACWMFGEVQRRLFGFDPFSARDWTFLGRILSAGSIGWSFRALVAWPLSWAAGGIASAAGAWIWYRMGSAVLLEQLEKWTDSADGPQIAETAKTGAPAATVPAAPAAAAPPVPAAALSVPALRLQVEAPLPPAPVPGARPEPFLDTAAMRPGANGGEGDRADAPQLVDPTAAAHPPAAPEVDQSGAPVRGGPDVVEDAGDHDDLRQAVLELRGEIEDRRAQLADAEGENDRETADFLAEKLADLERELEDFEAQLAGGRRESDGVDSVAIAAAGSLKEEALMEEDVLASGIEALAMAAYGDAEGAEPEADDGLDIAEPGSAWHAAANAAVLSYCTPGQVELLRRWPIPGPDAGFSQFVDLLAVTEAGILAIVGWDRPSTSHAAGADEEAWLDGDGKPWLSGAARSVLAWSRLRDGVPGLLLGLSDDLDAMIRSGRADGFIRVLLLATRGLPATFDRIELDRRSIATVQLHERLSIGPGRPLGGLVEEVYFRLLNHRG